MGLINRNSKNHAPAKLSRPECRGVVVRPRLFELLDEGFQRPVLWIKGLPGAGKTSLINSYIDDRGLPCLWYQVDERDNDIASFFYYLGLAVRNAFPRKNMKLPRFAPQFTTNVESFSRRYFEELYAKLKPPGVIVFDNYQDVAAESALHGALMSCIASVPRGMRLVFLSREDPPHSFARATAERKMSFLGPDELHFTEPEIREFLQSCGDEGAAAEKAGVLREKTGGWAAGLVLLVECVRRSGHCLTESALPGEVFNFFAYEVLRTMEDVDQGVLLKVSVFPSATGEMATSLTGVAGAGRVLERLSNSHYFTYRAAGRDGEYHFHPLFREFLRDQAARHFSQEDLSVLRKKAAFLLEDKDRIDEAVSLLVLEREWEAMIRIILANALSMANQGRSQTLRNWISQIPETQTNAEPWLLFWHGTTSLYTRRRGGIAHLERAFSVFQERGDRFGAAIACAGVLESAFFQGYKAGGAEFYVEWLDANADEIFDKMPSPKAMRIFQGVSSHLPEGGGEDPRSERTQLIMETGLRIFRGMLLVLSTRRQASPMFTRWADRAVAFSERCPLPDVKASLLCTVQAAYIHMFEVAKPALVYEKLRSGVSPEDLQPLVRIQWHLSEAMQFCLIQADGRQGLEAAECGLALAGETGVAILNDVLALYAGMNAIVMEDENKLDQYVRVMEDLPPHESRFFWENMLKIYGDMFRKDYQKAFGTVIAMHDGLDPRNVMTRTVLRMQSANILFLMGSVERAEAIIEEERPHFLEDGGKTGDSNLIALFLLTDACISFKRNKTEYAAAVLEKALAILRRAGMINHLFWWKPVFAFACQKALEQGIEPDYARRLILKRGLFPEEPPYRVMNWPWKARVMTFGAFGFSTGEQEARITGKAQVKQLELLKALVVFGGSKVSSELLMDSLWPDADGDMANQSLRQSVYRLRGLLGEDRAIETGGGKVSLNPRYIWVDSIAFAYLSRAARKAWDEDRSSPDAVRLLEQALALYKGHFLSNDAEAHILKHRENMRRMFIRNVEMLGNAYREKRDWEKAVSLYERGLEVDELIEDLYLKLMSCYRELGRRDQVVAVYNRCKDVINQSFGFEPSDKMEALYRSMTS